MLDKRRQISAINVLIRRVSIDAPSYNQVSGNFVKAN